MDHVVVSLEILPELAQLFMSMKITRVMVQRDPLYPRPHRLMLCLLPHYGYLNEVR